MVECSVCRVRSSVGECKECARPLCETCGIPCQRCHKLVCREHRSLTPGGRNLCPACMEHREWKIQRKAEESAAREQKENSGFQALLADLGETPGDGGPADPEAGVDEFRPEWAGEAPAPPPPREERPRTLDDELNARVLTGSGAQPRPIWINSALLGALACAMLLFAPVGLQPWITYLISVIALSAMVYAFSGYRQRQETVQNQRLSGIGFGLGLIALIVAWVIR